MITESAKGIKFAILSDGKAYRLDAGNSVAAKAGYVQSAFDARTMTRHPLYAEYAAAAVEAGCETVAYSFRGVIDADGRLGRVSPPWQGVDPATIDGVLP